MIREHHQNSIGDRAPDFELPGTDGEVYHLTRYLETQQAVGVIFMSNQCPSVRSYLARLKQIQSDFSDRGLLLIGINANDAEQCPEESFAQMKTFAREHQLNFPYLRDSSQDVAHSFGAQIAPHVFLLDRAGTIRYCGAIDDSPDSPETVQHPFLRKAIAALLDGKDIETTNTEPVGCSLRWRET
ncbi:MAG: thioredoxin family protein [Cyanobacteriota bacterium]|nr:thioredoxin family protein [Cyanobacteriota bacterium]